MAVSCIPSDFEIAVLCSNSVRRFVCSSDRHPGSLIGHGVRLPLSGFDPEFELGP